MTCSNRGAILSELRQLVNEIDNNNYVARKLYDYCEKSSPQEDSNDEVLPDIPIVDPMMAPLVPHYHMSELISTSITIVVRVIQTMREFIRNVFTCIIGAPNMKSVAIQYDNMIKSKRTIKPQKSKSKTRNMFADINKSDLKLALGTKLDGSTYFMYENRESHTMTNTTSSTENSFDLYTLELKRRKQSTKSSSFSFAGNSTTLTEKVDVPKVELQTILSGDYNKMVTPIEYDQSKLDNAVRLSTISTQPAESSHSSSRFKKRPPRVIHKNHSFDATERVGDVTDTRFIKSGRL